MDGLIHPPTAKIDGYKVAVLGGPNSISLDVEVLLVTNEGHVWMFHVNLSSKIHPTEAIDYISLPVLGNGVCVTGDRELEGRVWDVARPFILVQSNLLMNFFICCARGIEFAYRLYQNASSGKDEGVFF